MQPYIFPYIGYFQLINAVDKFIIFDDVNFIVRGWINRNKILINNEEHLFTIPLKKSSRNRLIKDIEIDESAHWKPKFLKTLQRSYKNSPYFSEVFSLISDIISVNERSISKLIHQSLISLNEYLGINTVIEESSSAYNNSGLKSHERIIDICRQENSGTYVNPPGGKEIYSKSIFEKNDVKLLFIKPDIIKYKQFGGEFKESLSIIDVLMFNPKEKVREYLNEYELV